MRAYTCSLDSAVKAFSRTNENVISWTRTTPISACGDNGDSVMVMGLSLFTEMLYDDAFSQHNCSQQVFEDMRIAGVRPNKITFVAFYQLVAVLVWKTNRRPIDGQRLRARNHRSMKNQTVNDSMNMTADPNAQITGFDGVHQQPINPNARIVRSDGGQTPVGHVPSGHVPVGHTVIGQFSVPLGQISA
ncbi:hypothetical protein AgCh_007379 [Apium graveolens]